MMGTSVDSGANPYRDAYNNGRQVGIREVVEWYQAQNFLQVEHEENGTGYCNYGCRACLIDNQLKEWGL